MARLKTKLQSFYRTHQSSLYTFVMLAAGALILFFTGVKPKAISDSKVFNAGMIAVVMIKVCQAIFLSQFSGVSGSQP